MNCFFHFGNRLFTRAARKTGVIAVLVCGAGLLGQVPDEAQKAATKWLVTSCDEGQEHELEAILEKYKTQLEPVFLRALEQGPDAQQIAATQAAAAKQFQRRQEALKTGKGLNLSDADLQAARYVTSEQYLKQQRDDYILRYRSQAAAGLGIVDGEKGKAALRALVQDSQSPLRSSAQAALSRLEPKQGQYKK